MTSIIIDTPIVRPLGTPLRPSDAQEIWDAFVVPYQADDAPPQSVEMRMLMALLRAFAAGTEVES